MVLNYMLEARDVKDLKPALNRMLDAKEFEIPASRQSRPRRYAMVSHPIAAPLTNALRTGQTARNRTGERIPRVRTSNPVDA
jgi:hypothetical protein